MHLHFRPVYIFSFQIDSAKYRAFFPDTVKCFLQSSNGESLVANIITFNVVTMALNVWAQARTFKIVLGSFLSIYNAFQTILCFPK